MISATLDWLLAAEPKLIPIDAVDRALLQSAVWGIPARPANPGTTRCHLRNLSARRLLQVSGGGDGRCWTLTESGLKSILNQPGDLYQKTCRGHCQTKCTGR